MTTLSRLPIPGLTTASLLILLALPPGVAAHAGITVGAYEVEVGWSDEPAVVGHSNAIQVTITKHDTAQPVTDVAAGDLVVTVSAAGQDSPALPLIPAFNSASGAALLGKYEAAFVPPVEGDYTFHVKGSIHDTPVDATFDGSATSTVAEPEPEPGPDLIVVAGGAALLLLLAGMAFLLFRVRSAPADPPLQG